MAATLQLPVVPAPDWETTEENEEDVDRLNDTAESLVLYHSLRQSRNTWLTQVFPKFSSKLKGKHQPEDPNLQPHNIHLIGKCDVEIGPHVFHDTSVYEVKYISEPVTVPTFQFAQGSSLITAGSQSQSFRSFSTQPSPLTSLASAIDVTPALIAQVNAAASSNPVLQNLLHIAAHNTATIDQLKTLAALIQSLATQPTAPYPNAVFDPSARTPASSLLGVPNSHLTSQDSSRKSDLLVEFRENSNDRLLLPQGIAFAERPISVGDRQEIVLGMFVPLEEARNDEALQRPAILRLRKVSSALSDAIWNWLSENIRAPDAKQAFHAKVKEMPERAFLRYRIPDGELLSQLQSMSTQYSMKSLEPSASSVTLSRPKRTPRKRKPPTVASTPIAPIPPLSLEPSSIRPITTTIAAALSAHPPPSTSTPPEVKKRKVSKVSKSLPPIACSVCGITDVPLLQGGRYCRTCLEDVVAKIPPPPSMDFQPSATSVNRTMQPVLSLTGRIDTFRGFIHHTPKQPARRSEGT